MKDCFYRREGNCLLSRFDKVTNGRCYGCQQNFQNKILGLGDLVALTINCTPLKLVKPLLEKRPNGCGCKQRQDKLNRWIGSKSKVPVPKPKPEKHWVDKKNKKCGCGAAPVRKD